MPVCGIAHNHLLIHRVAHSTSLPESSYTPFNIAATVAGEISPETGTMSLRPFFGRRSTSFESFDPFSLELWDPFDGLDVFDQRRRRLAFPAGETSTFAGGARIDWRETPTAHVFEADLPGMKKEEMKVEIEDGKVLQISGERRRDVEEVSDTWHRVERSSGSFMRRFRLPEDAVVDHVKATMENGVLTVTVPKDDAKKKKPDVKSVEIHG